MLVLVRHGTSTANDAGLLVGRADAPLTAGGRSQAAGVAALLGPVARVISSPLRRATETAALLDLGAPVALDDRWVEMDYGELDGRPLAQVPADVWTRWRADPDFRPQGGETLAEVSARVGAACDELFAEPGAGARAAGTDLVVVSHVSPIKAAVAWALGAGPALAWRLHLSTGSVTRIGWATGAPVLYDYNQCARPA